MKTVLLAVIVVIHNHAAVAPTVLDAATRAATRALEPLGIEVIPAPAPDAASVAPTLHVRILPRATTDPAPRSIVGVDVAETTGGSLHVAHALYQQIDDEGTTAYALGYVMAHLIAGVVESVGLHPRATIVRAGREDARRLARGASPFTPEQAETIHAGVSRLAMGVR